MKSAKSDPKNQEGKKRREKRREQYKSHAIPQSRGTYDNLQFIVEQQSDSSMECLKDAILYGTNNESQKEMEEDESSREFKIDLKRAHHIPNRSVIENSRPNYSFRKDPGPNDRLLQSENMVM